MKLSCRPSVSRSIEPPGPGGTVTVVGGATVVVVVDPGAVVDGGVSVVEGEAVDVVVPGPGGGGGAAHAAMVTATSGAAHSMATPDRDVITVPRSGRFRHPSSTRPAVGVRLATRDGRATSRRVYDGRDRRALR